MPPYDPNREMNGQPAGEPAPEPPPEQGGQELPGDPMGPMAGGLKQATPEEQAAADRFVGRAWQLIYADETFPTIIEMLRGGAGPAASPEQGGPPPAAGAAPEAVPPEGMPPEAGGASPPEAGVPPEAAPGEPVEGDPVAGLAQATDMVVALVGQAAEDAGVPLQPDVVFHAAGDILEELAEISRRAKIKDYSKDPDALETAWFQALDLYRERLQGAGVIDQQHAQADLDRLIAADKDGTYEKIMRDLAANDEFWPGRRPGSTAEESQREKAERFQRRDGGLRWLALQEHLLAGLRRDGAQGRSRGSRRSARKSCICSTWSSSARRTR